MSELDEFLAGERLDDVAIYVSGGYLDADGRLAELGEQIDDGVVLVVPGEQGRRAFAAGVGMEAMEFAQGAMGREGQIGPYLATGRCPAGESDDDAHRIKFTFAFAEGRNEAVGGLYAKGDVLHAYARCSCGEDYSDKWVIGGSSGGNMGSSDSRPLE